MAITGTSVATLALALTAAMGTAQAAGPAAQAGKTDRETVTLRPAFDLDPLTEAIIVPAGETLSAGTELERIVRIEPANDVPAASYGPGTFIDNMALIPWDAAAIVGGIAAVGYADWDWGSSGGFFIDKEGFFGKKTTSGGMDKLGHAFTTAVMSDILTARMVSKGANPDHAALTGALVSFGVMGAIEVFDGSSKKYGFSPEDLAMDGAGVLFSYLRNTVPGLKEKVDFRMEYVPSGYDGFNPYGDYAGQKYIMALKLSGFENFEDTPLQYLELHAGYFAEGYTRDERIDRGIGRSRHPYLGIGLNVERILFGEQQDGEDIALRLSRGVLQHLQVPFTYGATDMDAYHY